MFKSRITPIIAVTALVVAVFGATPLGQAASRLVLPKNSVGAAQIKKSAVAGKKLAKNSVTSAKVKDGSLLAADFKVGQLPAGPKGATGPRGLQGIQGIQGEKGSPGTSSFTQLSDSSSDVIPVPANGTISGTATCAGQGRAVGGGVNGDNGLVIQSSFAQTANKWFASVRNTNGIATSMIVHVICASP
jgi:hypothetical protein